MCTRSPSCSRMRAPALTSMVSSSSWVAEVRRSVATVTPPTIAPPISSGAQPVASVLARAAAASVRESFFIVGIPIRLFIAAQQLDVDGVDKGVQQHALRLDNARLARMADPDL